MLCIYKKGRGYEWAISELGVSSDPDYGQLAFTMPMVLQIWKGESPHFYTGGPNSGGNA